MAEIERVRKRLEPAAARAGALVLPLHGSLPAADQDRRTRAGRPPQGHFEHERRRDLADHRRGHHRGRHRPGSHGVATMPNAESTAGSWPGSVAPQPTSVPAGPVGPDRDVASASGPNENTAAWRSFEHPEIHRVDLSATVLALHAWGTADPAQFAWYDPPRPSDWPPRNGCSPCWAGWPALLRGSPRWGNEMLALPIHPRLARLLVAARHDGRIRDGAAVAALLSERDIRAG